jgi:CheY-like chemotaxis protein
MGGVECIRSYREWVLQDPHNPDRRANEDLLIIGLSANASGEDRKEAFKCGMHFFCPKPAETSLLAAILKLRRKAVDLKEAVGMIESLTRYAEDRADDNASVSSSRDDGAGERDRGHSGGGGGGPGRKSESGKGKSLAVGGLLELMFEGRNMSGKTSAKLAAWKIFSARSVMEAEYESRPVTPR